MTVFTMARLPSLKLLACIGSRSQRFAGSALPLLHKAAGSALPLLQQGALVLKFAVTIVEKQSLATARMVLLRR
jgi:hypothetical protein